MQHGNNTQGSSAELVISEFSNDEERPLAIAAILIYTELIDLNSLCTCECVIEIYLKGMKQMSHITGTPCLGLCTTV